METLRSIAADFYHSFYYKEWIGKEDLVKRLTIEEAYKVQDLVTEVRIESGEHIVGYKVGCTSKAIRRQFDLTEPIHGKLFYPHVTSFQSQFGYGDFINCAIEPEMVFKIGQTLQGKNLSDDQLIGSIEHVNVGLEVHEFNFWIKPPTIQELICSGGIHTGLIIGDDKASTEALSFSTEIFSVYKNGDLVTSSPASEIMGSPIHSLRWLVNTLTDKNLELKKGSLVIPGSPVELITINENIEVRISIEGIGSLSVNFYEGK